MEGFGSSNLFEGDLGARGTGPISEEILPTPPFLPSQHQALGGKFRFFGNLICSGGPRSEGGRALIPPNGSRRRGGPFERRVTPTSKILSFSRTDVCVCPFVLSSREEEKEGEVWKSGSNVMYLVVDSAPTIGMEKQNANS